MEIFNKLYGANADYSVKKSRFEKTGEDFKRAFSAPCHYFSASGRIEILGNHTDHNHGNVLVGAISLDIAAAAAKRADGMVIIKSEGYEDISFNVTDIAAKDIEKGKSISLIKGVIKGLTDRGYKIGGLSAVMTSNIFKGAGVSSSAAYEVLFSKMFSYFYCNDSVTPLDMAKISQFAESKYFGKPCGLLDQSGIAFGGVNHIDFSDIENPKVSTILPDFKDLSIIITNTGGDHSNLTPEYSAVKNDMHDVSRHFGQEFLRDVPYEKFMTEIPALKAKVGGRAILRAIHFYEENKRVDTAANALRQGDINAFLACVNLSGESSYKLLQNCYPSGDSRQEIPLALQLSKQILCGEGAVRVHGGGFAGTIIAFVPQKLKAKYIAEMVRVFGEENVVSLSLRNVGAAKVEF